jgi:hypothetical protein
MTTSPARNRYSRRKPFRKTDQCPLRLFEGFAAPYWILRRWSLIA